MPMFLLFLCVAITVIVMLMGLGCWIIELAKQKCPHCGRPLEMNDTGNLLVCKFCGPIEHVRRLVLSD